MKLGPLCALLFALALTSRADAQQPEWAYGGEVLRFRPQRRALPARLEQQQRALDGHLETLAARGEGRILRGASYAALGAGALATGFFFAEGARPLLYLIGVTTMSQGVAELAFVPDPEKLGRAYLRMPLRDAREVRARFRFGEEALSSIARGERRARLFGGTITMVTAAAYTPLVYWAERRADASYRFGDSPFDFVSIAISAANFVTGLLAVVAKSEAEQRAAAYRLLRERNEREAPGELQQLARRTSLQVAASVRGATIGARVAY